MKTINIYFSSFLAAVAFIVISLPYSHAQNSPHQHNLVAKHYYSGFKEAAGTWNAVSFASDGKIYYCLSSQIEDKGGQIYVYDPESDQIEHLGDLTEICGESISSSLPQGKVHSNFYERRGKLYFASHAGYYEKVDGTEKMINESSGRKKVYPGGHFLSYDLSSGEFEDLAKVSDGEAIVTMTMDTIRGQIYAISWPHGYLLHYDVERNKLKNLGSYSDQGEAGTPGKDYQVLCRSMVVDPRYGYVYFSNAKGDIFFYHPNLDSIQKVDGVDLRLDYFGSWDTSRPGSMGYGWRRIVWYAPEGVAYGIHGGSGYLFRFDPLKKKIEIVERLVSEPSKKSGMYDQFKYGYLGFKLGPDGETLYYLTGGPIYKNGKRVNDNAKAIAAGISSSSGTWGGRGSENVHLVTYNIPRKKYMDHGPIFYQDGTRPLRAELVHYINAIAFDSNGNIYSCGQFEYDGIVIEDLMKFSNPLISN